MSSPVERDVLRSLPADDAVIVFRTVQSGVQGRLVRLGAVAQKIISAHAMPDAVSEALGEALVLAALLGSALTDESNISVQTRTDGAISVLYADCQAPGQLRGYARCDAGAFDGGRDADSTHNKPALLGDGHVAFTIAQGEAAPYQGVIALDGRSLEAAAAAYFEKNENLPALVRLSVGRNFSASGGGAPVAMRWRAGGLMMQSPSPAAYGDSDAWPRVCMLAATIEQHEFLDPALTPEALLLRLFHEEGVAIERVVPLKAYCKCSREKILSVLASFGPSELCDMRDDTGKIAVTCEFCAAQYAFDFADLG